MLVESRHACAAKCLARIGMAEVISNLASAILRSSVFYFRYTERPKASLRLVAPHALQPRVVAGHNHGDGSDERPQRHAEQG